MLVALAAFTLVTVAVAISFPITPSVAISLSAAPSMAFRSASSLVDNMRGTSNVRPAVSRPMMHDSMLCGTMHNVVLHGTMMRPPVIGVTVFSVSVMSMVIVPYAAYHDGVHGWKNRTDIDSNRNIIPITGLTDAWGELNKKQRCHNENSLPRHIFLLSLKLH